MTDPLLDDVVVPVADSEDALSTARLLKSYDPGHVTVVHVVEKGGGVPDKTPVEQSEAIAGEAFDAFRQVFADAATETAYGRDVVEGIVEVAADLDASAIVFRPRGGSRIVQLLSGDRSLRLVQEADRPVIVLPEAENAE